MNYIKGKVRNIIYHNNENGYSVAVFRVKEVNDPSLEDFVNRTITITGTFLEINTEEVFFLYGEYIRHERFGYQYRVDSYKKEELTSENAILEFLASPLIKGCGRITAEKIVNEYKTEALSKIKENIENLTKLGLTLEKARVIQDSLNSYQDGDATILALKELGFSMGEAVRIYIKFGSSTKLIMNADLYVLTELLDFDKIDFIYQKNHEENDIIRLKACILESMRRLSNNRGDIYYLEEEIKSSLKQEFNLILDDIEFSEVMYTLETEKRIVFEDNHYYLSEYYEAEEDIVNHLFLLNETNITPIYGILEELETLEQVEHVSYNSEQKKAIISSLENKITIISGGPGTGKTTIIKAIVDIYIKMHHLHNTEILANIALLAPTGRASKKMSLATNLPAMTIHRYLKWNQETNSFGVDENHQTNEKLIIIDEMSMIDVTLFQALLKGIKKNVQLIMVGDVFQLPSVGPGLILQDLIASEQFLYVSLEHIYRQSENSYIPYLALEIKKKDLSFDFMNRRDDYNFIPAQNTNLKDTIKKICLLSKEKGLNENDIQVLAPMYKGENGIDQLNILMQEIFNPCNPKKKEIKIGEIIYREHDKVLQLQNNPDCNVFNGDIGFINEIVPAMFSESKKTEVYVDFDGNIVMYTPKDLNKIKH